MHVPNVSPYSCLHSTLYDRCNRLTSLHHIKQPSIILAHAGQGRHDDTEAG